MKRRMTLATVVVLCVISIAVGAVAANAVRKIEAELRPDFEIVIDGAERVFKNAQGEVVYPVLYEGTTYLPIRAIGELMGKIVYWYEDDKRIEFKNEDTTVTDADVIVTDKPDKTPDKKSENKTDEGNFIGKDRAKEIALEKAGLAENEVNFVKAELDKDNGVWKYEIEIKQGKIEYDVEIKAETGEIIKFEKDID